MKKIKPKYRIWIAFFALASLLFAINYNTSQLQEKTSDDEIIDSAICDLNIIIGHDEQDTIIGNFTGKGIDTLFVETNVTVKPNSGAIITYYMNSSNKHIPKIKLSSWHGDSPKLVNEGDLDGNGTCEVGYLNTWTYGQWKYYSIYTFAGNEWRYLIKGDYLDTPAAFRMSGYEVAESGKEKGTVLIHYADQYFDTKENAFSWAIRDTIVTPTFAKITD